MTTEIEKKEISPSTNIITEIKEEQDENKNEENETKQLTNEEALNIQIEFLNSTAKNVLGSIIQNEPDPMSINYDTEIKNKNIDKGIFLYLQNVHTKHYCNEINYILNSMNSKISYINDKNKEFLQNKKFVEREVNTISQEKIDYFNEKENLDKHLELLTLNARQNSMICKTDTSVNMNLSTNFINTNEIDDIELAQKTKQLEGLKKNIIKYLIIFQRIKKNIRY